MTESAVRIAILFPDLLGTYGDRGNATVLARRLRWRGHRSEVVDVPADRPVPASCDLYLLGGGEDIAQQEAVRLLDRGGFPAAVAAGATVLAVCAGLQILGTASLDVTGETQPGLGLLELTSRPGPRRAIGEMVAHTNPALGLADPLLTGFENHRRLTSLGPGAAPLATVDIGTGNGDGTEGVAAGRVIGTYLHGPVLARNPALADRLLAFATRSSIDPTDPPDLESLRQAALRRAAQRRSRWRGARDRMSLRRWASPGIRDM